MTKRRDMRLSEVEYREHAARVTRWQHPPIVAAAPQEKPEWKSVDSQKGAGWFTGRIGKWGNVP